MGKLDRITIDPKVFGGKPYGVLYKDEISGFQDIRYSRVFSLLVSFTRKSFLTILILKGKIYRWKTDYGGKKC